MIPIAKPQIGEDEMEAVQQVMKTGQIASGPMVQGFEEAWAEYCGVEHAVAASNGTTALHAALEAFGIGPGDEVIVPAFTFVATANAVLYTGGTPALADVDRETFSIQEQDLERALTERTKAIIPVHLYGQAADMDGIQRFAKKHGLMVLGDAAQAHGAGFQGRRVGGFGNAETFSFYPTKNMTSGEGGMITTNDEELAKLMRSIVNHGRAKSLLGSYDHLRRGHNFRMTDVHAAIGISQLRRLEGFNKRRREIARVYDKAFSGLKTIKPPKVSMGNIHVYHQYTLVCEDRAPIMEHLKANDIGVGVYYPRPLHDYPHLAPYGHSRLEAAEWLADHVLSIPVHPGLSDDDVEQVVEQVVAADERAQKAIQKA